ncbi:MAG: hypothetical protein HRT69_05105 [Flavobacteriaceae bacterium]|nr:hypothetical protein [Flavobacteriaceae bacterium]
MRNLIMFLLLCSLMSVYSQDIESIKHSDTIYLFFKHKKGEVVNLGPNKINSRINRASYYRFILKDSSFNSPKTKTYFEFRRNNYLDFDDYSVNKLADVKVVKKCFLRKKKEQIVTLDFIKRNMGSTKKEILSFYYEVLNNRTKTFYLIDSNEIKKRKIILREVKWNIFSNDLEDTDDMEEIIIK